MVKLHQDLNILFIKKDIEKTYSKNNRRTLHYTLSNDRYCKVKSLIGDKYEDKHHLPLGEFIDYLANLNSHDYKLFLNKYGHHSFCEFKIQQNLDKKGLYCFIVDKKIQYVGRCTDNFKKRINYGYGKISPKNCFIDGQATNCHINQLINLCKSEVTIGIYDMSKEDKETIIALEEELLRSNIFNWNIQLQAKK